MIEPHTIRLCVANGLPKSDLILLDVMMPEMSGYTVLDKIRNNSVTRDISATTMVTNCLRQFPAKTQR